MKWGKQDATDEEIMEALKIAQAKDVVESKQGGLNAGLMQGGKNLSGGQRQRLTIARAIVRKPDILILDDSASALDFATDARLRKAIREKTDGMTVFIVSQRATTVKQADKIMVLDDGRLAGIGKHKELFENCPVYRAVSYTHLDVYKRQGQWYVKNGALSLQGPPLRFLVFLSGILGCHSGSYRYFSRRYSI